MQIRNWRAGIAGLTILAATGGFLWSVKPVVPMEIPEMVTIPAGRFSYRPGGEYRRGTTVLTPAMETIAANAPLTIMRYPVTEEAYAACVAELACLATQGTGSADLAQTFVSFIDASAFAAWQSARTGQTWRLPTDAEWVRAAGEVWADVGLPDASTDDPAQRWIAAYRANADLRGDADPVLHRLSEQPVNSYGLGGLGGNMWEWTTGCFSRVSLGDDGTATPPSSDYCGVRAAQGRHRAYIIDFVRDARVGGCAVGLPPDFLGFRLVRD